MDNLEANKILTSDIQLTKYATDVWKGMSGTFWYISSLNAICILSNPIRKCKPLNSYSIQIEEYEEARNSIFVRGSLALFIRNYTPNLYMDDNVTCIVDSVTDLDEDSYHAIIDNHIQHTFGYPNRHSNQIIYELKSLKQFHNEVSTDDLFSLFQLDYRILDSSVVLYLLRSMYNHLYTDDLSEQMGLPGRKILCRIEGVSYSEKIFAQREGTVPFIYAYRYCNDEYNINIYNPFHQLIEYSFSHGFMGCLLNYCTYLSLLDQMSPIYYGTVNYDHLFALANLAIPISIVRFFVTRKKEIADAYISTRFQEVKNSLLRDPSCFSISDEQVMEQIYLENRRWIKEDALSPYFPEPQHRVFMENCYGFIQYMRDQYAYLNKVEKNCEDPSPEFIWPWYSSEAVAIDKVAFENQLRKVCHEGGKFLTHKIKVYLEAKEKQKFIYRPKMVKEEFEIILKFGYPYHLSAYYKP